MTNYDKSSFYPENVGNISKISLTFSETEIYQVTKPMC